MEYVYLAFGAIVSVLLIEKLSLKNPEVKPWIVFILIFTSFAIGIYIIKDKNKKDDYSSNSGIINGTLKDGVLYPVISIGGAQFIQDNNELGKLLGIDLQAYIKDKKLFINTSIFNTKGDVIAIIVANEWQTNPNNSFDKNYDDYAVEVKDSKNRVALQVEYDGTKVALAGIFNTSKKMPVILYPVKGGGAMEFTNQPDTIGDIIPAIFMYPGIKHTGKRLPKIH